MPSIKPPQPLTRHHRGQTTIFLAGSIDNGAAENWQERVEGHFSDQPEVLLLNPRRNDWDASWKQDITDPQFFQQVTWELNGLDRADHIILYFAPGSKAPISLLELGLYASSGKVAICCSEGFWRRGNVEIVAERFGIPFYEELEGLLEGEFGGFID
jgi:hypothetical protein